MSDTEVEYSERGFFFQEPTATAYGATVRFSESSAAMQPHIWLWAEQPDLDYPGALKPSETPVHMRLDQAIEIHKKLGDAIELTKERWGIDE